MSSVSQFFGGGVKSVQTGYVVTASPASGSAEDTRYVDVTISSVNTAKSVVRFDGGATNVSTTGLAFARHKADMSSTEGAFVCTARLTSATNLRASSPFNIGAFGVIAGRWTVVEYE